MTEKRVRIWVSMAIALLVVLFYESAVSFIVKGEYKKYLVLRRPASVTATPMPAQAPYFDPTPTPAPPTNTPIPTRPPIPTAVRVPSPARPLPTPTRRVTAPPARKPTAAPTKAPAAPQPPPASSSPSRSKLSAFMIGHYTEGARRILEANPPLIKVIEPVSDPAFFEAIRAWRQRVPGGVSVVRFYNGTAGLYYPATSDPSASAQDFFNKVVKPGLDGLGGNKNLFDYLQSPNEFENTPEWRGEANMKWNGAFWRKLTELNSQAGIKTCIGGIPVGNIEAPELKFMLEDLKAMKNMGAAFCYHGYTFNYSHDVGHEIYYSLRYRQYYDYFRANVPELASMPLILSEGGVAEGGDPYAGYLKNNKVSQFEDWLTWFDSEMRQDPYVVGVTLFQIGNDSDWGNFDLEKISSWMGDYLRNSK